MLSEIKSKNPEMNEHISCLLQLDGKDLIQSNLKTRQKKLWKDFKDGFNATLIILRSNHGKKFAFYLS